MCTLIGQHNYMYNHVHVFVTQYRVTDCIVLAVLICVCAVEYLEVTPVLSLEANSCCVIANLPVVHWFTKAFLPHNKDVEVHCSSPASCSYMYNVVSLTGTILLATVWLNCFYPHTCCVWEWDK